MSLLAKIWVPKSAQPKFFCKVPGCGETFRADERRHYEEHTAACAREHHDELVARMRQARPDALFEPFDPEYADWAKRHGRIA